MRSVALTCCVSGLATLLAMGCSRQPTAAPGPVAGAAQAAPPAQTATPAPAATTNIQHEHVVAIALASAAPLAPRTESSCADVAADAGWSTLAELVRAVRADADQESSSCEAMTGGGWQCELRFQNVAGGEAAEFLCVLQLVITSAEQVDPGTIRCAFAG